MIFRLATSSIYPGWPPSSSPPFSNGETSRLTNRLSWKVSAVGLFGLNSKTMSQLLVKAGTLAIPGWVGSGFPLPFPIHCSFDSPRSADVSYTKAPSWVKAFPDNQADKSSRFWDLARLSFPDARREWLNSGQPIDQIPSPALDVIEDPDQQMLCMDYLYYTGAVTGVGRQR